MANTAEDSPVRVALVGCGGIGYHLAEPLFRLLAARPESELYLVDGKDVRMKNLDRQFDRAAFAQNKAEVLAERLERLQPDHHRVHVRAFPHFLEPALLDFHAEWLRDERPLTLFCGVDNAVSRVYLEQLLLRRRDITFVTGGNGWSSGQVVLFRRRNGRSLDPLPSEIDPDLLERAESAAHYPSTEPCDELTPSQPQLGLANMGAAWAMLSLWYAKVLIPVPSVRYNYLSFDVLAPHVSPFERPALSSPRGTPPPKGSDV